MSRHPFTFERQYSSMIAAGEAGGVLDTILKRLASYIEKNVKLRAQVTSAMTYPVAVLLIAAVVVAAILWKVIPTFVSLFDGLGATLPLPTLVVIWLSNSFVAAFPVIVAVIAVGPLAFRHYYRREHGRRVVDGALLRIPVLGLVLRKVAVARFCRTLSILLASGVPILEGLEITARTVGNAVIEGAILTAKGAIEGGDSVSVPLQGTGVFPLMVTQMINIGETTGALDTMLAKIAEFYEEEVEAAVSGMLTLLESMTIALLGVVVSAIVIAMCLPIFDLISRMAG